MDSDSTSPLQCNDSNKFTFKQENLYKTRNDEGFGLPDPDLPAMVILQSPHYRSNSTKADSLITRFYLFCARKT